MWSGVSMVNLEDFIMGFGFSRDEVLAVMDELYSYRSIPGTNMDRYIRRVVSSLPGQDRSSFLKGLFLGTSIRTANDDIMFQEDILLEEEKIIDRDLRWLMEG